MVAGACLICGSTIRIRKQQKSLQKGSYRGGIMRLKGAFVGLVASVALSFIHPAAADLVCTQADSDFVIRKSELKYDIEYKTILVHRIGAAQLRDLFGGKPPITECDVGLSSHNVMGVVAGWKRDLLIAFGIVRDVNGRPIRLNMLSWSPHSGSFSPIALNGPNEFVVRYGSFNTRICWNRGGGKCGSSVAITTIRRRDHAIVPKGLLGRINI